MFLDQVEMPGTVQGFFSITQASKTTVYTTEIYNNMKGNKYWYFKVQGMWVAQLGAGS